MPAAADGQTAVDQSLEGHFEGIDRGATLRARLIFGNERGRAIRTQEFDALVEGVFDDGSGPQPVILQGPVTTVVRGKGGATTGSWDTEILSMDLSGDVGGIPIEIRESPSLPSPGETRVEDIGGGEFRIDSFFDVFTELSIDGGPFQPQVNEATRMDLPEPGLSLGVLSALPLLHWLARRRSRRRLAVRRMDASREML